VKQISVITIQQAELGLAYVPVAKFLVAGDPAENCRLARHPGIATDAAKAFAVDQPVADRPGDLGVIIGWTAALVLPQLRNAAICSSPRYRLRGLAA
jgi:hypothetical protein